MNEINENQIKQAHSALKELFQVPFEQQDFGWKKQLYSLVPEAWFEIRGRIADPSGRPYIAVMLAEDVQIEQIKLSLANPDRKIAPQLEMQILDFPSLVGEAIRNLSGIAIISTEEDQRPDALIRLGSIWSYCEYRDLAGCGNVVADFDSAYAQDPQNPFDLVVKDSNRYTVGKPTEAFFPSYVRETMTEEIQSVYPSSQPDISLLTEERYAMPMSILVTLGAEVVNRQKEQLQSQLTWYMPPYLPVRVA